MSIDVATYSLIKHKEGHYIPGSYEPGDPKGHTVSFKSGKIESINWFEWSSEKGFVCDVSPYKMEENETIALTAINLIDKGWKILSSDVREEAEKFIQIWRTEIENKEKSGQEVPDRDNMARYQAMLKFW